MRLSNRYALPVLILIGLFVFIPAVLVLILSVYKTNFLSWQFVGLQNYGKLLHGNFPVSVVNSFIYLACIPLPGIIISLAVVLGLANLKKREQNSLVFIFMLPSFAAGLIISQFWRWIIRALEIDVSMRFPGVPTVAFTVTIAVIGMQTLLLYSAMNGIDPTQYEAAKIDGASWIQIKLFIILPQLLKNASVMLLFGLVGALQIWESIYILAPFKDTASMMFRVFQDGFVFGKYGLASAECVIMALIIVLITQGKNRLERTK